MDGYSENAPEGVWENIADQLDVDEVWDNIANELEASRKTPVFPLWWKRAAMIAGIMITIPLGYVLFNFNLSNNQVAEQSANTESNAVENLQQEPLIGENPQDPQNNNTTENRTENTLLVEQGQEQKDILPGRPVEKENNDLLATRSGNTGLLADNTINRSVADIYIPLKDSPENNIHPVFPHLNEDIALYTAEEFLISPGDPSQTSSFALGFSSAIKNTWLFNRETFEGLDRLNHNRAGIKIYPDLGIALRYFHNARWSFESDLFLSSATGQNYQQYINGKYTERNISLRYFQGEILAGYASGVRYRAGSQPLQLKTVGGFYISRLNSATEIINGLESDIASHYQNMDAGLVLGQHIDWQISNRLSISPGFRIKWGLSDIYRNTGATNAFSNTTHNRSFEFRLNFYYHLQK